MARAGISVSDAGAPTPAPAARSRSKPAHRDRQLPSRIDCLLPHARSLRHSRCSCVHSQCLECAGSTYRPIDLSTTAFISSLAIGLQMRVTALAVITAASAPGLNVETALPRVRRQWLPRPRLGRCIRPAASVRRERTGVTWTCVPVLCVRYTGCRCR